MNEKQKFVPYLLKRMFSWFTALLLIVTLVVSLTVYKDSNTCNTMYCNGECGYRWCWGREHSWIHGCD